jgi:AAA ATPase domain
MVRFLCRFGFPDQNGAMQGPLIGRESEHRLLDKFLVRVREGPAALVLSGEPGIGKTVLWEAGVEEARRGFGRVLSHRSVAAEASFAFGGLSDLLADVLEQVAPSLAPPRRRALEVALLLAEPGGEPPDPGAIGLALLDALRLLAGRRPVLLALDDLQWLDSSTAAVLPVALRRLRGERVGLLATVREDLEAGPGPELERCFDEGRVQLLRPAGRGCAAPPAQGAPLAGADAPRAGPDPGDVGRQPVLRFRAGSRAGAVEPAVVGGPSPAGAGESARAPRRAPGPAPRGRPRPRGLRRRPGPADGGGVGRRRGRPCGDAGGPGRRCAGGRAGAGGREGAVRAPAAGIHLLRAGLPGEAAGGASSAGRCGLRPRGAGAAPGPGRRRPGRGRRLGAGRRHRAGSGPRRPGGGGRPQRAGRRADAGRPDEGAPEAPAGGGPAPPGGRPGARVADARAAAGGGRPGARADRRARHAGLHAPRRCPHDDQFLRPGAR